ncbi:hypothetical protein RIF29_37152 [Crotalaria pallida]|uniref:Glycosyltransferase n=1 Tax=Crotalaria pallida TaxID=3830 RepID=A0AAN9HW64_CROPI
MEIHKPAHVVLLSSPGLGHLIPFIELGNRFALHHNLKVTVIAVTSETSAAETQLIKSATKPNLINIIQLPSQDISHLIKPDAAVVTRLCVMMREAKPAIRTSLSNMTPQPSVFIVDIFGTESLPIAKDFNLLNYVFVASHAWFLSLVIYTPVLDKQIEGQYVEQQEELKIPGCRSVRPEEVVDPMLDRNDMQYEEYLGVGNGIPKSDGVLINTWEELQHSDLQALRDEDLLGGILNKIPVYGIGPIARQPVSETSQETELVLQWLDKQPSESVIYVSFGSGGTMSFEQMTELAWALELSEQRFIWVVRAPTEVAADAAFLSTGFTSNSDDNNEVVANYLPEGFLSRTHNVGILVLEWAPQEAILRHPSIGGFLSHCGWNSTIESLTNGVPMIAWPLYAEQRMNATLLAEEMGVAVRPKVLPLKKVVDREEIASMVREIMVVDQNAKGNPIRERVKEIKNSAEKALLEGGSSRVAMSEVLLTAKDHCRACKRKNRRLELHLHVLELGRVSHWLHWQHTDVL